MMPALMVCIMVARIRRCMDGDCLHYSHEGNSLVA